MKSTHVSDHEIQLIVSDYASCTPEVLQHVRTCSRCNSSVETYRLLFAGLGEQPRPAFDFDVAALALSNVRTTAKKHLWTIALNWSIIAIVIATIGATTYLFDGYLVNLFSGVPTTALYLICITAATFLAFQATDIIKNYKKLITNLDIR